MGDNYSSAFSDLGEIKVAVDQVFVTDFIHSLEEAEEVGEVAVDTETSSLNPHLAELVGVSLSTKIGKACYIPVGHNSKKSIDRDLVLTKKNTMYSKFGDTFFYVILFKRNTLLSIN